jgi:hypothetical protein
MEVNNRFDGLWALQQLRTTVNDLTAAESIEDRFEIAGVANVQLDDLYAAFGAQEDQRPQLQMEPDQVCFCHSRKRI